MCLPIALKDAKRTVRIKSSIGENAVLVKRAVIEREHRRPPVRRQGAGEVFRIREKPVSARPQMVEVRPEPLRADRESALEIPDMVVHEDRSPDGHSRCLHHDLISKREPWQRILLMQCGSVLRFLRRTLSGQEGSCQDPARQHCRAKAESAAHLPHNQRFK